jgi:glycosyltransferase involved in cell wall biosynthesis
VRIVFFIDHLRPDGTQRFLSQVTEGLAGRGHAIAIVCLNDSWDTQLVARLRHVAEVRIIGQRALLRGHGIATALVWLRGRRFDAAVTLLYMSDILGRALARAAGIRYLVTSIRARNIHYTSWQRRMLQLTAHLVDRVVLNSAAAREFAVQHEGADAERIVVIPNGVETSRYARPALRGALGHELQIPEGSYLIGSVGRLSHQKGFDLLITALSSLPQTTTYLLLFGKGEERQSLERQAAACGIGDRVRFAGYRDDMEAIYGALDLYVHPARFEGMPNAVLEAMAAGCPIVATAIDGSQELIEDGVHGWLVPPEDPRALACAIGAALADSDEARRRGAAAQARAAREYSIDAMVDAWERVLQQ